MENTVFFKRIYVEITNVCNQTCPFCPKTARAPQFLPLANFQILLERLQGHGEHLYFHVLGEPLLHPELAEFLTMAHAGGFFVNLVTNGVKIEEVGPVLLNAASLRQVNFSLHSLSHLGLAETKGRLAKILNFIDQADTTRLYCSLRLWTGGIEANRPVLEALSQHFALDFDLEEAVVASGGRGFSLKDRIFLNPAEEFAWPSLDAPLRPGLAFCQGLKQQIAILVDGSVVPCCLDGEGVICLGNIYKQTLAEIWQSPRTQAILRGFAKGQAVEELCQRCEYRTRFTR